MPLVQEQMFAVAVSVDGVTIPGLFDGWDGGEVTSGSDTYNAGGMADAEALPGPVSTGEITISRGYRGERDAILERWLLTRLNRPMVGGRQALNPDKSPVVGGLLTARGILTGVATPTHDSNGTAVSRLELTMLPHGTPT
jgi:hypothetical protein